MSMFRKKPVVIEARQVTPESCMDIARWCNALGGMIVEGPPIPIETLEGTMFANDGDWVIRGVAGEFYPCKPDIFDATYEPA